MEMRQLEMFMEVAERKSFSGAAKALGVSQPTVSLQMKQLEEELDTPLFYRTTREVRLTETGEILLREGRELLDHRNRVLNRLAPAGKKTMVIGASQIPTGYLLPKFLRDYRKIRPEVIVIVEEGNSGETLEKTDRHLVDIGLTGMKETSESCVFTPIFRDKLVLVAPNTERNRKLGEAKDYRVFFREPLIYREGGSGIKYYMDKILESCGYTKRDLDIVAYVNNVDTIKKLIREGIGCSVLSEIAVKDEAEAGELLVYDIPDMTRDLYLVQNKNIPTPDYVEDFIRLIKG